MSELVKQLRDQSNSGATCKELVLKAADEIERLQAELERWQDASQDSDGA